MAKAKPKKPARVAKPKPPKGGPGSGRKPEMGHEYTERPSSVNPGRPRAGVSPRDLYPYGRNPDGTPKPKPGR